MSLNLHCGRAKCWFIFIYQFHLSTRGTPGFPPFSNTDRITRVGWTYTDSVKCLIKKYRTVISAELVKLINCCILWRCQYWHCDLAIVTYWSCWYSGYAFPESLCILSQGSSKNHYLDAKIDRRVNFNQISTPIWRHQISRPRPWEVQFFFAFFVFVKRRQQAVR